MERAKKLRIPVRRNITRVINEAEVEIMKDPSDIDVLEDKETRLKELQEQVRGFDQQILEVMADEDATEDEIEAEYVGTEHVNRKILKALREICQKRATLQAPVLQQNPHVAGAAGAPPIVAARDNDRVYHLPKIELYKFNGELTEWLPFWSQFQKIHQDDRIPDCDKFSYLVQSLVPGTTAKEVVSSFNPTADNYPHAVDALRQRFGKEELIQQVYLRELLKMSNNAKHTTTKDIPKLFVKLQANLRSLETIGIQRQQYAVVLYPILESCLPEDLLIAWQRHANYGRDGMVLVPPQTSLCFLMDFLEKEVQYLTARKLASDGFATTSMDSEAPTNSPNRRQRRNDNIPTAAGLMTGKGQLCLFCEKSHDCRECSKARELSIEDKKSKVQKSGACFNCLKIGHSVKKCKSFVKCIVCGQKHLVVMCLGLQGPKKDAGKPKPEIKTLGSVAINCTREVLLQTLMVKVKGRDRDVTARLLIDSGSQMSFVRRATVEKLALRSVRKEVLRKALFGGGVTQPQMHQVYELELQRYDSNEHDIIIITVMDEQTVCGRIPKVPEGPWMQELERLNITISDGESTSNAEIDILVGSDFMGKLVTGNMIQLDSGLTAAETVLGWTLYGRLSTLNDSAAVLVSTSYLDSSIQNLWSLETLGIKESPDALNKEDKELAAREHFKRTVVRQPDGRYSVSLPWITGGLDIPNNRTIAEARLKTATTKLKAQQQYHTYNKIFLQWLEEGIIEETPEEEVNNRSHYLPHRPIFKPESLTTPVRPVFDASCKKGRAPSLNECLEKGPNLMELIPSILHRFREKKVGIVSDIRKAFQMIDLNRDDRNFVRFLWWEDETSTIYKEFRHARVVFGINSSPFLLAAVLEQHLRSYEGERGEVAQLLLGSLYVDNCITSVSTMDEYSHFKMIATEIMAEAKMELRQWECSAGEGARVGPTEDPGCGLEPASEYIHPELSTVLGMKWDKGTDELFCLVPKKEIPLVITKRVILSQVQQVFDPLGILSPALLLPKLMLQRAWQKDVGWDQQLDTETENNFRQWWADASVMEEVRIPRNVSSYSLKDYAQIHVFCDASQYAFAAAVFLRVQESSHIKVQLLQAKARIAPLKKVTIPRLELLSCTIAARLAASVIRSLKLEDVPTFFWSDSTTALAWIKRNDDWGTFVGNRVREICRLSSTTSWRHVPGIMNPADLPSRGCTPRELLKSRWWEGPRWLSLSEGEWPCSSPEAKEEEVAIEKKKTSACMAVGTSHEIPWYCRRYSSFRKNVRMLAWIMRFIRKSRKQSTTKGALLGEEIEQAERKLYQLVQKESFLYDVKNRTIDGVRVEDKDGLFVVQTKLINRQDRPGFVYPIILPSNHPAVEQIIRQEHLDNHHGGIQFLMGKLRERLWIMQGRRAIKKVVRKCVICKLYSEKSPVVPEAPLPEDRVKDAKAFEVIGVDLAGPLFLKEKKKTWIVLFTCAVYRCVHLELVESLSTDAFLLALHRFVSRRGRPTTIYSDNGTNFVGAENMFQKLDWKRIQRDTNAQKIRWKFNPPSGAWWGGWWERLIRSVKDLLRKMLGHQKLRYVQLETCLCEAESIINGRPLTYVTEDPEDLIPLTPSMFIQDVRSSAFPEADALNGEELRTSLNTLQTMRQELRCRFRKEYLSLLIQRKKGKQPHIFQVGDIVHIGSDNKKRLDWPLGRIVELLPGTDGKVRVGKIKTATGTLLRPLQRLFPLEVSNEDNANIVSDKVQDEMCEGVTNNKVRSEKEEATTEVKTRHGRIIRPPVRFAQMNIAFKLKI